MAVEKNNNNLEKSEDCQIRSKFHSSNEQIIHRRNYQVEILF